MRTLALFCLCVAAPVSAQYDLRIEPEHAVRWEALLAAEDARASAPEQLALLRAATRSPEPALRAMSVRALGRLERAEELPSILPLLHDSAPVVRAFAANAAAQAVLGGGAVAREAARSALSAALALDGRDGAATPVIAESLGRLRHPDAAAGRATLELLLPLLDDDAMRTGALRGLYFLARQPAARGAWEMAALERLRRAALDGAGSTAERARVLAVATLAAAGGADSSTLHRAALDAAPFVRREVVAAAGAGSDTALMRSVITRMFGDSSGVVRYEALRQYGRRLLSDGCAPVREAVADAYVHTALLAIDLLAGCGDAADAALLRPLAENITSERESWHRAAHALVALAALDTAGAARLLGAFSAHDNFFVRTYAAHAAARMNDEAVLRRLAGDEHANVRTAAVVALAGSGSRAADDVFIGQLARDESELLQAAARALDGSSHAAAAGALLDALDRVSLRREETSRDARRALLERVRQLGGASHAVRLEPYLADFDAVIANLAADILGEWTGVRPESAPVPLQPLPLPTYDELRRLQSARVVVELDEGDVELRLLASAAPTNAARFARLAGAGYYDGLTLHRVVPNFVVQGGSPGANEYHGDGPFTRDELGLDGNWRGTVGLSTRGRDTGDAQFYINTVDNVRLDHEYTVFAVIVSGMDVIDRVLEGAVLRRVRVEY